MPRPATLVAQDYTDIQDRYAYYTRCSDAGDADGFVWCFKSEDKARRKGRVRRHWNSGLHLEHIDSTTVRGRCYLHAYEAPSGLALALVDMGVYEDTLVHEEGEWRFRRREIHMDHRKFTVPPAK